MKKIREKLAKIGDFLLFWCVIFPIFFVMWRLLFRNFDKKN